MNKKGSFLPILLGVISACAVVLIIGFLSIDSILRRFAPELYLGTKIISTVNEINSEKSDIENVFADVTKLQDSHKAVVDSDLNGTSLSFNENYNKTESLIYINGHIKNDAFDNNIDFYLNDSETGFSLPDIADVYFIANSSEFGKDWNSSLIKNIAPFDINENMRLAPSTWIADSETVPFSSIYPILKNLIAQADIKKISGEKDKYMVYLNKDLFKQTLIDTLDLYKNSDTVNDKLSIVSSISGDSGYSDFIFESLRNLVSETQISDDIAVEITERDDMITAAKTNIKTDKGVFSAMYDISQGARLLDSISLDISYLLDGENYGIEYKRDGNRFFRYENISDNMSLKLTIPFINSILIENNYKFSDENNFSGIFKLSGDIVDNISAEYLGSILDNSLNIEFNNIQAKGLSGNISLKIFPFEEFAVPERQKMNIRDLSFENIISLFKENLVNE